MSDSRPRGASRSAEHERLAEASADFPREWKAIGPYLAERAWGTVREDYSAEGRAWEYFPHEHARSRAYRWNEDGLAGVCDREQRLCLALAVGSGLGSVAAGPCCVDPAGLTCSPEEDPTMKEAIALLIALALASVFAGCAAIQRSEAASAERILAAAGFRQFPADTKPRIDALKTLKPRTVSTVVRNGQTYYVYPDPTNCNCLYVGTETNYQQYEKLALEKQIADEQVMAAESAEMDWGVWGPWW